MSGLGRGPYGASNLIELIEEMSFTTEERFLLDSPPAHMQYWVGVRKVRKPNKSFYIELTDRQLRTHALVLGSTGSGKTNFLHHVLYRDLLVGHSVVVLDLRGDLVSAVLEMCARGGVDPKRIRIIDLREKHRAQGFCPLTGPGNAHVRALGVLDLLRDENDSWGPRLEDTLRNALLLLAEAKQPLTRLSDLFYNPHFLAECLERCTDPGVITSWQRFEDESAAKQNDLALPVLNKLSRLLAARPVRNVLGHPNPIDLQACLNEPGSILLVSLAADELHATGRTLGRMVLASVCREVFSRVTTSEAERNPIRVYVDEFEHFGEAEFEHILAEGRRFGLSLVLAHQTLSQLSPRMRSMILNNVGVKALFRLGREDSSAMNKDLAGETKLIDFTTFPVGEMLLWRRDMGRTKVEVNEPILESVGGYSRAAQELLTVLYGDTSTEANDAPELKSLPEPERAEETKPAKPAATEDWLCE